MSQHDLKGWSFTLDHARQRCGSCNYRNKVISMSRHFAAMNNDYEITNVALHEIAHALVGPGQGHNSVWRETAVRIGARPEVCAPEHVNMPQPKWSLVCEHCARIVARRHRKSLRLERVRCAACGPSIGTLVWTEGDSSG
ncbi:MAG: putative SprT family Zn-dependent metalloprotease [Limisphaerales bacterium]|jgi:predicted SprT family Zn-dependent metalloprotease